MIISITVVLMKQNCFGSGYNSSNRVVGILDGIIAPARMTILRVAALPDGSAGNNDLFDLKNRSVYVHV